MALTEGALQKGSLRPPSTVVGQRAGIRHWENVCPWRNVCLWESVCSGHQGDPQGAEPFAEGWQMAHGQVGTQQDAAPRILSIPSSLCRASSNSLQ